MDETGAFERERARLTSMASRLLDDRHEAEDVVQMAWLRLHDTSANVTNLPAWLTTVTTRLCLDRLRARIPRPAEAMDAPSGGPEHAVAMERAEAVGQALHLVVATMTPDERVAFVLADTFGFDFATIGEILERSPAAARKLASRARSKAAPGASGGPVSDWQVVDAFMAAARGGDLRRLLELLAPDAHISADAAAILAGTPESILGRSAVADFFDGSALAALAAFVEGRPGSAWFHRGHPMVAFDFTVESGVVQSIVFRAEQSVLDTVARRADGGRIRGDPVTSEAPHPS